MNDEIHPIETGKAFPCMKGTSLDMRSVAIPPEPAAELTLVMLGFTHAAGQQMAAWAERFRQAFAAHLLDYYKIAMVGDFADLELESLVRVMVVNTPPAERPHILVVKGDASTWRRWVSVERETEAYLFLLDRSGVVRWKGIGPLRGRSFGQLARACRAVLGRVDVARDQGEDPGQDRPPDL